MIFPRRTFLIATAAFLSGCASRRRTTLPPVTVTPSQVERVSTAVPFPRGLQLVDGKLYVLARGRVREAGGVDPSLDDQAGTIFEVDSNICESIDSPAPSELVRTNAKIFAAPTSPPFKLLDRTQTDPTRDRETDRPYCSLRYDPTTRNFFLCAFSGIDKPDDSPGGNFSKNTADGLIRFDTRTRTWHDVERHRPEAGGNYPHHDPASNRPPHGWLNGPDNCLAVGRWLYACSKDNSLLVRYDLADIAKDPHAPAPQSHWTLGEEVHLRRLGKRRLAGHSMLAARDGYLYLGHRTSSTIIRFPLDGDALPVQPIRAELIAQFDPYDPKTRRSANLTDMVFGPDGDLFVVSAQPSRIHRFHPDPGRVFDARNGAARPWADMAALTNNPTMKSENLLVDDAGRVYVTSGDAYNPLHRSFGTVYRVNPAI